MTKSLSDLKPGDEVVIYRTWHVTGKLEQSYRLATVHKVSAKTIEAGGAQFMRETGDLRRGSVRYGSGSILTLSQEAFDAERQAATKEARRIQAAKDATASREAIETRQREALERVEKFMIAWQVEPHADGGCCLRASRDGDGVDRHLLFADLIEVVNMAKRL